MAKVTFKPNGKQQYPGFEENAYYQAAAGDHIFRCIDHALFPLAGGLIMQVASLDLSRYVRLGGIITIDTDTK